MAILVAITILTAVLVPVTAEGPVGPFDAWPGPASKDNISEENQTNETDPMLEIGTKVYINTNWGDIVLGMYEVGAPITTNNFLNLTKRGFYNGIKFHRIIDDFVIQTGDPNTKDNNPYNDGWGGSEETIPLETSPNVTHVDGAVGMARSSEPDSASSQFYICDTPQPHLDGDYAVFAIVLEGMDTVRTIATAETYGYKRPALKDHPVDDIIMNTVSIIVEEDDDDKNGAQGSYPMISGVEVGVGGLFILGIGFMVLVVLVFVVRKVVRRRRAADQDDAIEVEPLDEGGLFYSEEEGPDEERWGRSTGRKKDWFEV
jgi:peptidyl-prolyl cis-trans isomerase B (cyclophilin B)